MKKFIISTVFILSLMSAGSVRADILWDWSTGSPGVTVPSLVSLANYRPGYHYADHVTFQYDVVVDGMDIYTTLYFGSTANHLAPVGMPVIVEYWTDDNGTPGAVMNIIATQLTEVDYAGAAQGTYRAHAELPDLELNKNTKYWFTMAAEGIDKDLGLIYITNAPGGNNQMISITTDTSFVDTFSTAQVTGDMSFRIHGTYRETPPLATPEPGTIALLGCGAVAIPFLRRKLSDWGM